MNFKFINFIKIINNKNMNNNINDNLNKNKDKDKENVENIIKKVISKQFNIQINKIKDETSLKKDLEADSLDIVEFVMTLEEKFNIEILDEDIEKLDIFINILKHVENIILNDKNK